MDRRLGSSHYLGLLEQTTLGQPLIQRIVDFWSASYRSDRVAFYFEMISFVFTVAGSATLAINAAGPPMHIIFPMYFVGAVTQCVASYRRGSAWIMTLTFYFSCLNIFGFCRSIGLI